jgi:hypothetical protein
MKTIYYAKMTMILGFCAFFSIALTSNAQSVYVPDGQVDDSNNQNVGINVTNPEARLDIATDENTGALQISTTEGGFGISSNPMGVDITPYAFQVIHTEYDEQSSQWNTYTSVKFSATGKLSLGDFSSMSHSNKLNVTKQGIGVYNAPNDYVSLQYINDYSFYGPALNFTGATGNLVIAHNRRRVMQVTPNKQVLIGTDLAPSDYKLCIGGKAIAEEVVVKLKTNWPDYVFAPDYAMLTNAQLRAYITKNGKLPYLPKAEDVAENGVALGETQTQLTRLVEELTLRLLEMEERVKELESQLVE